MGLMDTAMQGDSELTADVDEFAEAVVYTHAAGGAVTIHAIIDRTPPARDTTYGNNTRTFDVWIPFSSTVGLTAKPTDGSKIAVKDDPSDSGTVTKLIRSNIEADTGGWLCEFA